MKRILICGRFFVIAFVGTGVTRAAQPGNSGPLEAAIRQRTAAVEQKVIGWRRDIHEHPELGDQEKRTSQLVAEHLRSLGLEVRTNVARTGVIGLLKGGHPGKMVALRADMDALPVKEPTGLSFASKATSRYEGEEVPVMHACGHDAHTAMLMGAAEVLSGLRNQLHGTVMFIFQPAEEGSSVYSPSSGKSWGAKLMLEEGIFKERKPDAVFAQHVMPGPLGQISYRTGAVTAGSDTLEMTVIGKQGHGGMPWNTIDPITTSATIISALQTVVSRRTDLTASPAVVTIGTIQGGSRANIVPDKVTMSGTIRSFDPRVQEQVSKDVQQITEKIAESAGAKAEVSILKNYPITMNNEKLTEQMLPVLQRVADGAVAHMSLSGASEDFSYYAQQVPGLYVMLGITPPDQDPTKAAPNHNPNFFVDEDALVVGTRTIATLAADFLGE
jgi:amidohydrolase